MTTHEYRGRSHTFHGLRTALLGLWLLAAGVMLLRWAKQHTPALPIGPYALDWLTVLILAPAGALTPFVCGFDYDDEDLGDVVGTAVLMVASASAAIRVVSDRVAAGLLAPAGAWMPSVVGGVQWLVGHRWVQMATDGLLIGAAFYSLFAVLPLITTTSRSRSLAAGAISLAALGAVHSGLFR